MREKAHQEISRLEAHAKADIQRKREEHDDQLEAERRDFENERRTFKNQQHDAAMRQIVRDAEAENLKKREERVARQDRENLDRMVAMTTQLKEDNYYEKAIVHAIAEIQHRYRRHGIAIEDPHELRDLVVDGLAKMKEWAEVLDKRGKHPPSTSQ